MKNIIGIDLGTTFSAIAKLDDHGQAAVVPVDGQRITASCILVQSKNSIEAGQVAYQALGTEPRSVVRRFKRDMGSDVVYSIEAGDDQTPISASALILRKLTEEAAKTEGPIKDVIITVPANFAERQRKATIAAGEAAGLNVINLINEPTAAVLAYAAKHSINGTVMVYDLGGGTFDVTIARVKGTNVECLTSEGDAALGGIDFDQKLADLIDQKYKEKFGRNLREALGLSSGEDERRSPEWQSLVMEAEKIKRSLSKLDTVKFVYGDGPDGSLRGEVTRKEFEQAISGLVGRTEMRIETALDNLEFKPEDIDVVLLVGGSTRVPVIQESIKRIMGKEGSQEVNPDEAVALGASIFAGIKADEGDLKPMQREALMAVSVGEVANHFFGFIAIGFDEERGTEELQVTTILRKDRPIPCSNTERFYTRAAGQQFLRFRLTQSVEEETDPEYVHVPFETKMGPFPPNRPAQQPLDITYSYDENQTMWIEVLDVNANEVHKATYKPDSKNMPAVKIPDFKID